MAEARPDPRARRDTWIITIVRSGGFAGLRREWRVSSADDPAIDWSALIADCPWNLKSTPAQARDHFEWRIEARSRASSRSATVPDQRLDGPWRLLVDQVKVTYKKARAAS